VANGVENHALFAQAEEMRLKLFAGLFLGAALASGCGQSPAPTPRAPTATAPTGPTKAQPTLQILNLWLGSEELKTELALTPIQLQTGMMFRTNMPENAAMLFVFSYVHQASFWMKNTTLPLSAAYIDPAGVILEIHDLQPLDTNSVTATSDQVQYVLEVNQGWFKRHNVSTGMVVRTERGSLRDTFFKR
jgi:uncharacterized membrane protein (UPF0127 family)